MRFDYVGWNNIIQNTKLTTSKAASSSYQNVFALTSDSDVWFFVWMDNSSKTIILHFFRYQQSREFWNSHEFPIFQILIWKPCRALEFELKVFHLVRIWIENFINRQILKWTFFWKNRLFKKLSSEKLHFDSYYSGKTPSCALSVLFKKHVSEATFSWNCQISNLKFFRFVKVLKFFFSSCQFFNWKSFTFLLL